MAKKPLPLVFIENHGPEITKTPNLGVAITIYFHRVFFAIMGVSKNRGTPK